MTGVAQKDEMSVRDRAIDAVGDVLDEGPTYRLIEVADAVLGAVEYEKLLHYIELLESGLSSHEARATVWAEGEA